MNIFETNWYRDIKHFTFHHGIHGRDAAPTYQRAKGLSPLQDAGEACLAPTVAFLFTLQLRGSPLNSHGPLHLAFHPIYPLPYAATAFSPKCSSIHAFKGTSSGLGDVYPKPPEGLAPNNCLRMGSLRSIK